MLESVDTDKIGFRAYIHRTPEAMVVDRGRGRRVPKERAQAAKPLPQKFWRTQKRLGVLPTWLSQESLEVAQVTSDKAFYELMLDNKFVTSMLAVCKIKLL